MCVAGASVRIESVMVSAALLAVAAAPPGAGGADIVFLERRRRKKRRRKGKKANFEKVICRPSSFALLHVLFCTDEE